MAICRIVETGRTPDQKVMAARSELGFGGERPPMTYFEVHKLLQ
jgi:hypothetical protein